MRRALLLLPLLACDPQAMAPAGPDGGHPLADPHDPLSMPASPTLVPGELPTAESCADCHPEHYAEWRTSMHAYAMTDPLFRALVAVRSKDFGGQRDAFCVQCHSAIGTRGGEIVPGFDFQALSPIVQQGVTCVACHRIAAVERLYNSGHRLDVQGALRGPIADPMPSSMHASEHSPLFESSELCGGCHDVVEYTGLPLERPYQEWLASPNRQAGGSCQGCHMPARSGVAATGGPPRTVHQHRFVGVDVPLAPGFLEPAEDEALRQQVAELLRGKAELRLEVAERRTRGAQLDVVITVRNKIDAHNFPTGSTFHRQLWLELVVRDAGGRVLYSTGELDAQGDLRDHWSTLEPYGDQDILRFGSRFVDARGNPVLFPWLAAEHISTALPPSYARTQTLFVDTSSAAAGPASIQARLRFRALPPFLLRALALDAAVERLSIFEVATASAAVALE